MASTYAPTRETLIPCRGILCRRPWQTPTWNTELRWIFWRTFPKRSLFAALDMAPEVHANQSPESTHFLIHRFADHRPGISTDWGVPRLPPQGALGRCAGY